MVSIKLKKIIDYYEKNNGKKVKNAKTHHRLPPAVRMAEVWGEAKHELVDFVVADPMVGEYAKYRFLIESECFRRWLLLSSPKG